MMKWSIRAVYFYLVSFVMLMTVVFGSISLVNDVIQLFEPSYYEATPDIGQELALRVELRRAYPEASEQEIARWAEERLTAQRVIQAKHDLYYRWRGVARNLVLIGVAFPVYRYHWRHAQQTGTAEG